MGAKMQPLIPLLPYQQRWVEDKSRFKLVNKARQTGFSFAVSLEVLLDALERKTLWVLLSKGERQSRELMDKVQMHAKAASYALDVIEADFKVGKDSYKQLELNLPNGSRIIALPANPDTARGFSGNVVLDEFAFHADSKAIWAALYPTITRGYKLRIISTPNGVGNQFEKLVSDPDNNWSKHEVDIYLAVSEGLDLNIEELRREAGSEDTWLQEYCCKFLDESSSFLTFDLINGCSDGKAARNLPELIDPAAQLYLGFDVARKKHLSVIWLLEKAGERYNTICVKEMQGMKFRDQRQLLYTFLDLPNLYRACIDATGIGAQLAEDAKLDYGYKVEPVMFTGASKEDMAVHIRGLFEDRLITIPKDDKIRDDLHSVKKVVTSGGSVRYVAPETDDGHADRFWALALAAHAGQPLHLLQIGRDFAAELRAEHPRHRREVLRLVVGIGNAPDVGINLFGRGLRHLERGREGFEQGRRGHVHPLVGALRREDHRHQQLVGVLVAQFAFGRGHVLRKPGDDAVVTLSDSHIFFFLDRRNRIFFTSSPAPSGQSARRGQARRSRHQRARYSPTGPLYDSTHNATEERLRSRAKRRLPSP